MRNYPTFVFDINAEGDKIRVDKIPGFGARSVNITEIDRDMAIGWAARLLDLALRLPG